MQEIAQLYDDAIASAERLILIENQYFTSRRVFDALHKRISDTSRPGIEVVVILPQAAQNWKEELAIGFEQRRMLQRLETAAKANHCPLGIYTPIKTGNPPLPPTPIYVHSKVLVIDDRILSIGSANTSNRSLGLDTECNINIEADGDQRRREIAMVCYTLLGEHLEQPAEAVESIVQQKRGWVTALDALSGQSGRLHKLNDTFPETWIDQVLPEGICFDPESPLSSEDLFEKLFFPPIPSIQDEEALEEKEQGEPQKPEAHPERSKKRTFLRGIPLFLLPPDRHSPLLFLEKKELIFAPG
ncbi:MAG: phospholipase D-like domain-containing protein [Candidatus Manganitrophus sp.]|nr:MAG: phospholipase D-like domain-containing protein [Candidatus Manganitrophus sp.]